MRRGCFVLAVDAEGEVWMCRSTDVRRSADARRLKDARVMPGVSVVVVLLRMSVDAALAV